MEIQPIIENYLNEYKQNIKELKEKVNSLESKVKMLESNLQILSKTKNEGINNILNIDIIELTSVALLVEFISNEKL